jgi:TonB family protein
LDAAAIKAVQRAGRLPKAPRGLEAGQVTFTLPISFKP